MTKWKAFLPFIHHSTRYQWRTNGARWELLAAGRVVARVLRDGTHAGMFHIDLGDGVLSDMVNLPRAKDAAVRMVDAREAAGKTLTSASPMPLQRRAGLSRPANLPLAADGILGA